MKRIIALMLACMLLIGAAMAETAATVSNDRGVNFVERMGLGFSISDGMALRSGDVLQTNAASGITVHMGDAYLAMNERAELKIESVEDGRLQTALNSGEMFVSVPADIFVCVSIGEHTLDMTDATACFAVRTGSASVSVLRGSVDGCEAGNTIDYVGDQISNAPFSVVSLNEFAISQVQKALETQMLCITQQEIDAVLADREAERQRAWDEQQAHDAAVLAQGGTERQTVDAADDPDAMYCTIEIRCDTILDHMDQLTEGKNSYVPANGTILAQSRVAFDENETVFDVLQRACEYAGIQLEYSWTPMYNSYYVEGINQLYEFDCGSESGWMYKVNGWFPNYGCSEYHLKDGDTIVWCYTCVGLGADVGGDVH